MVWLLQIAPIPIEGLPFALKTLNDHRKERSSPCIFISSYDAQNSAGRSGKGWTSINVVFPST